MNFHPAVGDEIRLFGRKYTFSKHPAVEGIDIPYGQEGRQGIVYQLSNERGKGQQKYIAFKVFRNRFKERHQVEATENLKLFTSTYGLSAASRSVLQNENHPKLINQYEDLEFSLIMPWIEGPTWADILIDEKELTPQQCLEAACTFAYVMAGLEEKGLAHCDLSSSNVIIPALSAAKTSRYFSGVELIDIEELYAPALKKPPILPGGSPGYAACYMEDGNWGPDADRFSGAVLLGEMISWHEKDIRGLKADDISFFDKEELQTDSERYSVMLSVITRTAGKQFAQLFQKAWSSKSPAECPTFSEWLSLFPKELQEKAERRHQEWLELKNDAQPASQPVETLLLLAAKFEDIGKKDAACREYQYIVENYSDRKAIAEEITEVLKSYPELPPDELQLDLEDYLEAARHFEKVDGTETAILFYERAISLPGIDFALREEIEFILDELRDKQEEERRKATTEARLEAILEEEAREHEEQSANVLPARKRKSQPFSKSFGAFVKRRWILITILLLITFGALGSVGIYNYAAEKKYDELIELGTVAFNEREFDKAEGYIAEAIKRKPTEDLYAKLATVYISDKRYEEAIRFLESLFMEKKLSDKNQEALYLAGRTYFLMKDYSNAILYYEKAAKGKKSEYEQDVLRDLVISYGQLNQYDKASALVDKLQSSDPASKAFNHNLKGELYSVKKEYMPAVEEFRKAVEIEPGNKRYIKNLVDVYIANNNSNLFTGEEQDKVYQEAIVLMNRLLEDDIGNPDYLNRIGKIYYDYGSFLKKEKKDEKSKNKSMELYRLSLDSYNQLLNLGIENEEILLNLGLLHEQLNDKKTAEKYFKKTIERYRDSGKGYLAYGLYKIRIGKYQDSVPLLNKVIQLNQDSFDSELAKNQLKELKAKGLIK